MELCFFVLVNRKKREKNEEFCFFHLYLFSLSILLCSSLLVPFEIFSFELNEHIFSNDICTWKRRAHSIITQNATCWLSFSCCNTFVFRFGFSFPLSLSLSLVVEQRQSAIPIAMAHCKSLFISFSVHCICPLSIRSHFLFAFALNTFCFLSVNTPALSDDPPLQFLRFTFRCNESCSYIMDSNLKRQKWHKKTSRSEAKYDWGELVDSSSYDENNICATVTIGNSDRSRKKTSKKRKCVCTKRKRWAHKVHSRSDGTDGLHK